MKKVLFWRRLVSLSTIAVVCLAFSLSCDNGISKKAGDENTAFFEANPPSITWKGADKEAITSFSADVEVYSMNNRRDQGATLSNKYRMSLRKVDGMQLVRLDLDPALNGNRARSILSNGNEVLIFDTKSNEIQYRIPIAMDVSQDLAFLSLETAISRFDMSLIRSESKRLAFDMTEDTENRLVLDLPSHLFQGRPGDTRLSTRVAFDSTNDTLQSIETVTMLEDGSTVTSFMQPVYEDKDGIPVKVGMISILDTKIESLIEGFGPDTEIFESPDDIPEISEDALAAMVAEGSIQEANAPVFGNPADLSHQDTIIELYREIEINAVPESAFKLLMGGK